MTWSQDGARVATSGADGTVRVWDARTGVPILVLRGHGSQVGLNPLLARRFEPRSSGPDGVVRIWALDLDDLIAIAERNVTRELTEPECREYLHLDACPTTSP